MNDDTLLAFVDYGNYSPGECAVPIYQTRTIYSNKQLRDYSIYKQAIQNGDEYTDPAGFFNSSDVLKPDGTKIVQMMGYFQQLNFLDLSTGDVVGYRMKGSYGFSVFENKDKIPYQYYANAEADDNYIYAAYWGKEPWGRLEIPFINTIHVFDWNGNLVQKITTDRTIGDMALDKVRNRLYTMDKATDEVFYLDLDGVLN